MEDIISNGFDPAKGRGLTNGLPSVCFDEDQAPFLVCKNEITDVEIAYSDVTRQWYWNDYSFPLDVLESQHRRIDLKGLPVSGAKVLFMVNLFHASAFDLAVVCHGRKGLGVLTVTKADMDSGNVYRSGTQSLDAVRLTLFIEKGDSDSGVHYLCFESPDRSWSVSSIRHADFLRDNDFIARRDELDGKSFSTEDDIVSALRNSAAQVDLSDKGRYIRVSIGWAEKPKGKADGYFRRAILREGYVEAQYVDKVVQRAEANLNEFYRLLRQVGLEGTEKLISAIHASSFSTAHSHSHHHYTTGTLEHSLGVLRELRVLAQGTGLDDDDIVLAALLHDISIGRSREWSRFEGHGRRSMKIVQRYLRGVDREVLLAIRMHRHRTGEDGVLNCEDHLLWKLLHKADHRDAAACNDARRFIASMDAGYADAGRRR